MYDIFISHNKQQKAWVRDFCCLLRNEGLRVFFDEDSIDPGENVIRAIETAIDNSRHVILVLSPSSLASDWVAMETTITIYKDPSASKRTLLPIMLEVLEYNLIPPSLRALNYIDLTKNDTRDKEFKRLMKCLGVSIDRIPLAPSWPQAPVSTKESQLSFLTVADIDNVICWGWDGNKLLDELIALDYQTIDGLTPDHEGQTNQWAPVFMDHPDTWRLIINGPGSIIGYWHFVPLFKTEHELARQGKLTDSQITTDKVRVFEFPGWYDIYFVSICILPKYRRTPALRLLFKSFLDVVMELSLEEVFIREICANAYTASGLALCKSLGLNLLTDHTDHGQIYSAEFKDLLGNELFKGYPELRRLYGWHVGSRHLRLL